MKIRLENFFCSQNWLRLVKFITKYGVISAMECASANKKREKFSRSQENGVRKMNFFVKMLLFIQ
jgi:hypothetical protein